jgi:ornithine cyclodeaminase
MTEIINLEQIKSLLEINEVASAIEHGFISYSQGKTQIPMPGNLGFNNPQGDCHIKYGHIHGDPYFVIKTATGFYANSKMGRASGHGMISIWCRKTGMLEAILLDNGYLTDIRTAIAGQIAARYLAPKHVHKIGVVGAGMQARVQLEFLKSIIDCNEVLLIGNSMESTKACQNYLSNVGFTVSIAKNVKELCQSCNLIITTTPSVSPLIFGPDIAKGTHITAVGADGNNKHEIHEEVFSKADLIVVDSVEQCSQYGDFSYALKLNKQLQSRAKELGSVIEQPQSFGRTNQDQISVCDLTGLAVQDIKIAISIYQKFLDKLANRQR